MATLTKLPDGRGTLGNLYTWLFDLVIGTYATGGIPLLGSAFNWHRVQFVLGLNENGNAAAGGYILKFDTANQKVLAFRSAGFTPAGTVAAPTFTGSALGNHAHSLLLKDAAVADGATTRVNAGANLLGANTGGDLTVAGAGANGGVQNASAGTPAGTNSAPAFTGTAVAAGALVQVANGVNLASITVRGMAVGR